MYFLPITRAEFLHFLPSGGEVAEIGVAKGGFSQEILNNARPDRLHLIDPWEFQDREDYLNDPNNAESTEQQARYEAILSRFGAEIAAGQVEVHRAYSQDIADDFADGQLDWVFIDGLHTYEGVKTDLEAYAPKVKEDGFVLGHDYTNHASAQHMQFGVVEAVNEFVIANGYAFIALTRENFPTYVLARSETAESARLLLTKLVYNVAGLTRLKDFPRKGDFTHEVVQIQGRINEIFSF